MYEPFYVGLVKRVFTFTFLVNCSYSGNLNLREGGRRGKHIDIIIGSSVGAAVLGIATIVSCLFIRRGRRSPDQGIHA